jgi:hypothetical protein
MAKNTAKSVVKAWSEKSGRLDQYDVREVTNFDGVEQTQLIDKDTGSVTVAVNGHGQEALDRLAEEAGVSLIDAGVAPQESTSADNKVQRTSRGVLATPTQPEALNDPTDPVVIEDPADEQREPNPLDVPTHRDPVTGGSAPGEASSSSKSSEPAKKES